MRKKDRRPTILIADDEAIFTMDLEKHLETMGYHVVKTVGRGEWAVDAAGSEKPDFILLDIRLAGLMSGLEAAAEIRTFSNVPIIFMTGYFADDAMKTDLEQVTHSAVIYKPFSPVKLAEVLKGFSETG